MNRSVVHYITEQSERVKIKFNDIVKSDFVLGMIYLEKGKFKSLNKKCYLNILISYKKKIYASRMSTFIKDKIFDSFDAYPFPPELINNYQKNNLIFDEDLLELNLSNVNYNRVVGSFINKKPFHNTLVDYEPDTNSLKGTLTTIFHAKIKSAKIIKNEIKEIKVNKHYYKPFFPFQKIEFIFELDPDKDYNTLSVRLRENTNEKCNIIFS